MPFLDKLKDQNRISKSILRNWDKLSEEKQSELLATLQKGKKNNNKQEESKWDTTIKEDSKKHNWNENLNWDTDAILNNLKNHITVIDRNAEISWIKWEKIRIELPEVWFIHEYFVSDDEYYDFESRLEPELKEKSHSIGEISELLQAINKYTSKLGIKNDGDMDYENELKLWEHGKFGCYAWDYLISIRKFWICWRYYTSDENVVWECRYNQCSFGRQHSGREKAHYFLKL